MSILIECDLCGIQILQDEKPLSPLSPWIHDSDYDTDFCSLNCKSKWSEELTDDEENIVTGEIE